MHARTLKDIMIDKFVAWFRDCVADGREMKPMQKYRKLATVHALACVPYTCGSIQTFLCLLGLGKE